jgi:hypothetical protein
MKRRGWGAGVLLVTALGVAAVACSSASHDSASTPAPAEADHEPVGVGG